MSKLSLITGALAALIVLLSFAGALCGAVVHEAADASLYGGRSRQAVREAMGFDSEEEVTAYIGVNAEEQEEFARLTAAYMAFSSDWEKDALTLPLLSEREASHMADVRALIALCDRGKAAFVPLAAALAVAMAWTGMRLARRRRAVLLGALAGGAIVAFAALAAALFVHTVGFERSFIGMHELAFTNDLWLMNPETDILIRMMPQLLFEQAAARVVNRALGAFVVTLAMLFAVYALIDGMSRRQLTERKP